MNRKKVLVLCVIFAIALISCNDSLDEADDECEDEYILRKEIVSLINAERAISCDCGDGSYDPAPPVSWNDKLAAAAMKHSKDMAGNVFLDHTGSDGSSPDDRIKAAGYSSMVWGENIAMGYVSAESVVDGWMVSPGHCANIMNSEYTEIGAASAIMDCGYVYWTLVLAKSK
jgi:uncharacterized protein YkwD